MAEHPFWDDDCLRGSIDRVPLPPPPQSLFEHDLFCYEEDIDNLPPLEDQLPPLPQSPMLHSPATNPLAVAIASPKNLPDILSTPPSPARQWGSFLDDNCPLRKRVKVTITQPPRKRESPVKELCSATLALQAKKRRSSPSRSAPRRLQTTLLLPRPGDPTPRLALHIPNDGKSSTRATLSQKPSAPQRPRRVSLPALQQRRCITSDLNERLKSMKMERKSVSSQLGNGLPLVEVAVQAVSRAAQAYRQALSRVTVFPSTSTGIGKSRHMARTVRERGSRKRRGKKGRKLLSFDDKDVAPLAEEGRNTETSALFNYLNSPSPWKTTVF